MWQRRSLGSVIGSATCVSAVYVISMALEWPAVVVLGLFALAIVVTVWMAIRILRDPYSTDKTFDRQFYQDRDDLRRSGTD